MPRDLTKLELLQEDLFIAKLTLEELYSQADEARFKARLAAADDTIAQLEKRLDEARAVRQRVIDNHERATPEAIERAKARLREAEAALFAHKHGNRIERFKDLIQKLEASGIDVSSLLEDEDNRDDETPNE